MKKIFLSIAIALAMADVSVAQTAESRLSQLTTHEKVGLLHAQSKFTSAGVPRLGIPQVNMDDGPHGVREELEWNSWKAAHQTNDSCVAFPSLTCLAATWNRELSRLYGDKVSEEFAYRGKHVMLGPGVTMARHPLNGRNFEYMGEDPYLAGEMVVPYIQAAQKNGVACCIKHFFLNNQEKWRFGVDVNVSERAVEEIYLPAFEKAVKEAHVWAVMPSYNKWLGVWNCENDSLLNGILKRRWGFDGVTISDWGGTHNTDGAARGGLDIEMGTDTNGKTLDKSLGYNTYRLADAFERGVNNGTYPMSLLNDKAQRVLRLIDRTALNPNRVIGKMCSEDHYDACEKIGEEGIVLMKNEELRLKKERMRLPLNPEKVHGLRILVVGENAIRNMSYGGGSSELKTKFDISPLEGLKAVFGSDVAYAQGYYSGKAMYGRQEKLDQHKQDSLKAEALAKAKDADLIIYIGGLNKNHGQDCEDGDREGYDLSFGQNELISDLAKIQKNIVVVTYGGNAFATPWIDKVPAFVHCWYLGSMSGLTLANVLSGKVNPSGKLPVTFAKNLSDYQFAKYGEEAYPGIITDSAKVASKVSWSGEGKTVYYKEGVFVGYRGFVGTVAEQGRSTKTKPQFPFGYGLSYTTFKYGKATVKENADSTAYTVTIPVTNTGKVQGKEVVELYVGLSSINHKPLTITQINRPSRELKGFEKLSLEPGETKTATFTVTTDDLRYYDDTKHQWTLAPGPYNIMVGASSEDIRSTVTVNVK